jgi:PAS domain S-box-containing protein
MSTPGKPRDLPSWAMRDAARIKTDREGLVLEWNGAAERLYGHSAEAAVGRSIVDLLVPVQSREQAAEIMLSIARGGSWEGEFDVLRSDRRLVRVLVHNAPSYDATGVPDGVVGHSVQATPAPPPQPVTRASHSVREQTRRLRRALFDPALQIGLPARASLTAAGVMLEVVWSFGARAIGRDQVVGVAGAVAIIVVLATAVVDVWAGLAVAILGGICFDVIVTYAAPHAPFAFGVPLIAVWAVSAAGAGAAAIALRRQAQRGVAEAVALHRELVGSLVPSPRLRRVDVSVAALYRPGERRLELGGDFYAATERSDSGLALLVGDVSGHGPEAAALAAMLRAGWEALVEAGVAPPARLQSLNRLLFAHARYEEFFATVCSVVIDSELREATVTLAGHPPPILLDHGTPVPYAVRTGVPLGVIEEAAWTPSRIVLPPSFSLLLYTDGVVEGRAAPAAEERFGESRLSALLATSPASGRELLDAIIETASGAHGGPLPDDAALLLLEHRPAGPAVASLPPRSTVRA